MREGLDAPTLELPAEKLEAIRSFLDGQSRFRLAVWVRHEQQGVEGPLYDHHLVLGVADEDWATGDMRALDSGLQLPLLVREPTWIDIFPVSEVEGLRSFGAVLWEQRTPGEDPLDYRFTHDEPILPSADALTTFAALVRARAPEVDRVTATRARLWKGESELEDSTDLCVSCYFDSIFPPGPLPIVQEAAREAGIAHDGASLVRPSKDGPEGILLYEAGA
jgi:hypothetical protein